MRICAKSESEREGCAARCTFPHVEYDDVLEVCPKSGNYVQTETREMTISPAVLLFGALVGAALRTRCDQAPGPTPSSPRRGWSAYDKLLSESVDTRTERDTGKRCD